MKAKLCSVGFYELRHSILQRQPDEDFAIKDFDNQGFESQDIGRQDLDQEALSALMDGEASELELRRLLRQLDQDAGSESRALRDTWARYHLARDVLHEAGRPVSVDLSRRIAAALEDEPLPATASVAGPAHWRQTVVKLAIAASVAVVGVFALQLSPPDSETPALLAQDEETLSVQPAAQAEAPTLLAESEPVAIDPVARQRLQDYLSTITVDESDRLPLQNIEDSPLFQLVNERLSLP